MLGEPPTVEALGVAGAPAPGRLTTTFRLTGGLLIDAGAAAHGIAPAHRREIADVLLSHSHLDHTLGLPFLLGGGLVRVWGLPETIDAVRSSLLDGRIWPDLRAHAEWRPFRQGERLRIGPWEIEVGPANHTVPCVSFHLVSESGSGAVIGDTRFDLAVARWAADRKPSWCIVECSFPDQKAEQARTFGHQNPRNLRDWRSVLGESARICVTHMKPVYEEVLRQQIAAAGDAGVHVLSQGDVLSS